MNTDKNDIKKNNESVGDAVKRFTEMLTAESGEQFFETNITSHTEKLKTYKDEVGINYNKNSKEKTDGEISSIDYSRIKASLFNILLVCYDILAVAFAYFLALWVRFDGRISQIPREYLTPYLEFIPFYVVFCIIIFAGLRLYKSLWKYASVIEAIRVAEATFVTGVAHIIFITLLVMRMPISYYIFGPVIQFFLVLGVRYSYRLYLIIRRRYTRDVSSLKRVMIIGAGEAGRNIIREINRSDEMNEIPVCVCDGDQSKWNKQIEGVPVVGGRESILLNVEKYKVEKIYFAIPSADKRTQRDILTICSQTHCELKTLPGIYQIANGEVDLKDMKDVAIEDLLGRDQVKVDMQEIFDQISGKVVLITGGGGSIGSEIALQVSRHNPKKLIKYCQGIQMASPVEAHSIPEPWDMPGYTDKVIMAAGAFTNGSSIELSCDAPIRSPYVAFMQGGLTYEYGKLGVLKAICNMEI